MLRLLFVFAGLALLVVVPFLIWGGDFERVLSAEAAAARLQGFGAWAWAAGIALIVADLFLPVPATAVMSALGSIYGAVIGGLIAGGGSVLAGVTGYLLCRALGRSMAARILGAEGLVAGERLFRNSGAWLVVLSRWLPVFPEVVACMAGLTRMPPATFLVALACGSMPLGFAFAAVGGAGLMHPGLALAVSAAAPPLLWLLLRPAFERLLRRQDGAAAQTEIRDA